MRNIRVQTTNGPRFTAALQAAGFRATWLGAGTASDTLAAGQFGDDYRHPCAHDPQSWGSIQTTASGRQAHRIFTAAAQ